MSGNGRPSVNKRNREQARKEQNQAKVARREQRAGVKKDRPADGEDPDIAGIVPGPQPPLWEI